MMEPVKLVTRLIVTGADGTGKSTLVEWLTENPDGPQLGPFLGHDGGPPNDVRDVYSRLDAIASHTVCIRDRSVSIDEPVYSTVFSRETPVSTLVLDGWLKSVQPAVLLCYCRNFQDAHISVEPKDHKDEELLKQTIKDSYRIQMAYLHRAKYLAQELGIMVIPFDYHHESYEDLMRKLISLDVVVPTSEIH